MYVPSHRAEGCAPTAMLPRRRPALWPIGHIQRPIAQGAGLLQSVVPLDLQEPSLSAIAALVGPDRPGAGLLPGRIRGYAGLIPSPGDRVAVSHADDQHPEPVILNRRDDTVRTNAIAPVFAQFSSKRFTQPARVIKWRNRSSR